VYRFLYLFTFYFLLFTFYFLLFTFSMILAIDIGGTQFGLILATTDGQVVKHLQRSTDRAGGAQWMIEQIISESRTLIQQSSKPVLACGIGFGGPVNFDTQHIINSTHVKGWDNCPLPQIITQELNLPAIVDNDANVGALGEFAFGAGKSNANLVYYTISTGIGGGIIINGQIYRGSNGNAGELGHCPILRNGPLCDCGNRGCLEALCSGTAIAKRVQQAVKKHPRKGRTIRHLTGENPITAKTLFDAAKQKDSFAQSLIQEICTDLGMGVATAMNAFAPNTIVIGGGVSKAGRVLFDPLRKETNRFLMPIHRPHLNIRQAKLKDRSVLLGAVALAKEIL
jgi:glucokinase